MTWAIGIAVAALAAALAAGVAFMKQPTWTSWPQPEDLRADPHRLRRDVEVLAQETFPRGFDDPDMLEKAATYVHESLAASGARVERQPYLAGGEECSNVVGTLGPPEGRAFVVGAHYDVFSTLPGADDNASGVAGLLELARLLGGQRLQTPVILVAYSTEEPPFFGTTQMGSWVHAAKLRASGAEIRGMVSLEMIGYFTERQPAPHPLLKLFYPRVGDFVAVVGRVGDRRLVRHLKKGFRSGDAVSVQGYVGPIILGIGLSDHRCYWAQGYSAAMVTDTAFIRNPHYHSAQDTPEKLDYRRMAAVVEGVARAVLAADRL